MSGENDSARSGPAWFLTFLIVGAVLRLSFAVPGVWQQPWTPHHADEAILPFEALALWEGVTPREIGWPASTMRLGLSVLYAADFLPRNVTALWSAPNPEAALRLVSHYLSARVADPVPLYVLGRWFSAFIGILQIWLTAWALARWLSRRGALVGLLLAVTAPLLVLYSQYTLSDVTGAMFAAVLVGLLPDAKPGDVRRAIGLGALAGLATASKFHFGIWLLPVLAAPWFRGEGASVRQRLVTTTISAIAFLAVLMVFVPWLWLNPVLAMKELTGVVLVKVGPGAGSWRQIGVNMWMLARGLGWAVIVGFLPGLWALRRACGARGLLIAVLTSTTLVVLACSAVVFDRYAIVLAPGALLISAAGLVWMIDGLVSRQTWGWPLALAVLCGVSLADPVIALRRAALVGSYHEAHAWMLAHLPNGARVVVYSEDNLYLPRSSEQLSGCADGIWTQQAYAEKWATNGVFVQDHVLSMRLAVLNDEFFRAFWCLRELDAPRPVAFTVRRFHRDPRFDTLNVETMQTEFNAGLADATRGFDAVLVHFPLDTPVPPARVFVSEPGPRLLLYLRPGLVLRNAAGP